MNRLIQRTVPLVLLALMAALAGLIFLTDTSAAEPRPAALQTHIACSPLSTAQVPVGTSQTCTIRLRNTGEVDAVAVQAYRDGGWTPTSITAWKRLTIRYSNGSTGSLVSTDGVACAPVEHAYCAAATLKGGDAFYIQIRATKPTGEDGASLSQACSRATNVEENCVNEAASLP